MIRKTLLAFLLLTVSATASAEAPKANGAYLGVSGGVTTADTDESGVLFESDQDVTVQVYLGYKFIKHFAMEARFADFGSYSVGSSSFDLSSLSIHAIGIIPFGESGWELFGQIGAAKIRQSSTSGSDKDSATTLGLGVRWHINPKIAVGIQVDAYVWQDDRSVAAETLSFQVNF